MARKRARLADNDPLNLSNAVLDPIEQDDQSTSQQDDITEQSESQPVNPLTSQEEEEVGEPVDLEESEQPENLTSQLDDTTASQPLQSTRSQVKKLTSQQEDKSIVELKKATFQIDKAVLTKLERFVLSLQLELGKENAPYKEVVVEEAIERLLATAPTKLLKALERRQRKRKD